MVISCGDGKFVSPLVCEEHLQAATGGVSQFLGPRIYWIGEYTNVNSTTIGIVSAIVAQILPRAAVLRPVELLHSTNGFVNIIHRLLGLVKWLENSSSRRSSSFGKSEGRKYSNRTRLSDRGR